LLSLNQRNRPGIFHNRGTFESDVVGCGVFEARLAAGRLRAEYASELIELHLLCYVVENQD
jgi:hypothetical protein